MTRAMAALTHGDVRGALAHNAGAWLVAGLALALASLLLLELATGRAWLERVWGVRAVRLATLVVVLVTMAFAWANNLAARFTGGGAHGCDAVSRAVSCEPGTRLGAFPILFTSAAAISDLVFVGVDTRPK
jgi:hypothetical protein